MDGVTGVIKSGDGVRAPNWTRLDGETAAGDQCAQRKPAPDDLAHR